MIRGRLHVTNVILGARQIHSSPALCNVKKQANMMAKLMSGSLRKRKSWYVSERQAKIPILPESKLFQTGALKKRRTDVLNKLFMRTVSDLLSTGEIKDLFGRGISITQLKVSPDFAVLNIFWTCPSTSTYDKELETVLQDAAFKLRHEMCQLHVLGKVPRINFVADKNQIVLENTEICLEKIKSMGDLDEVESADELDSEYSLQLSLEPEILEKIRDLEEISLPEMTHDVLGLDHLKIMNKIQVAVKKSHATHRYEAVNENIDITYSGSRSSVVGDYSSGKDEVAKFITKQRIKKKKEMRQMKKALLDNSDYNFIHPEDYVDVEDGDFCEELDASSTRET